MTLKSDSRRAMKHDVLIILWNRSENRLRALWRLLVTIVLGLFGPAVLKVLASFVIAFSLVLAAQIPLGALGNGRQLLQAINTTFIRFPLLIGIRSLIVLLLVGLAIVLIARFIDRRPWRDYGFHFDAAWWRDLGFGLFLGLALMGVIFRVEYSLGWASVSGLMENGQPNLPTWQLLVDGLFFYVLVGVEEEWLFRGYLIRNLAEGLHLPRVGPKAAVLLSYLLASLFFALLHANNANATLVSLLDLALFGMFVGLGFVLTGELAIPIGIHIAWNFAQGYVFGFPVSGTDEHLSLIATQQSGPTLWTGGAFGPEGGLVGVLATLLGMVLVYGWVRWTRRRVSAQAKLAQYSPS